MHFTQPFYQLPIRFCAETLQKELRALPADAWRPHPTGFVGNEAIRLITPFGEDTDRLEGAMAPTPNLLNCCYTMQVMEELGGVWGRSRFMGLAPRAEVPGHVDTHYYWRTHLRIHIPVVTNPGVSFDCGKETVHMAAGECWVFDSFQRHQVRNESDEQRVHLVLDSVVTDTLFDLIEQSKEGAAGREFRFLAPGERSGDRLAFEKMNTPRVMTPWEIAAHIDYLASKTVPSEAVGPVMKALRRFHCTWAGKWAQFGEADEGLPVYRDLLMRLRSDLRELRAGRIHLNNGKLLYNSLECLIILQAAAGDRVERLRDASRSNEEQPAL